MTGFLGLFTGAIILVIIYGLFQVRLYANTDPEDSASHSVHNDLADA